MTRKSYNILGVKISFQSGPLWTPPLNLCFDNLECQEINCPWPANLVLIALFAQEFLFKLVQTKFHRIISSKIYNVWKLPFFSSLNLLNRWKRSAYGGLSYHIHRFLWGCTWPGGRLGGWGGWTTGAEGGLWSSDLRGLTGAVFGLRRAVHRRWSAVWSGLGHAHLWLATHMVVVLPILVLAEGSAVPCHITTTACLTGLPTTVPATL